MLHYLHPFLWTQPALKKICSAVRRTKWRSRQWFRSWCRHENMGKNTLETWWFLGLMVASLLLLVHPWKMPFQISHLGRPFERARHSRGGTKCSTATLTFLLVVNIQFLSHIHFIMCHLRWLRLIWFWSWLWTPKIRWWNRTCSLETPGWDYPNDLTQLQISSRPLSSGKSLGAQAVISRFSRKSWKRQFKWVTSVWSHLYQQANCLWLAMINPTAYAHDDWRYDRCLPFKNSFVIGFRPQNKVRWALQSSHWGPAPIDPFWRLNLAQDEHQNLSHVKPTITILNTDTKHDEFDTQPSPTSRVLWCQIFWFPASLLPFLRLSQSNNAAEIAGKAAANSAKEGVSSLGLIKEWGVWDTPAMKTIPWKRWLGGHSKHHSKYIQIRYTHNKQPLLGMIYYGVYHISYHLVISHELRSMIIPHFFWGDGIEAKPWGFWGWNQQGSTIPMWIRYF